MRKLFILSITTFILIVNTSCVQRVFNRPTTVSTKSTVLTALKDVRLLEKVSAESCAYVFVFIPIVDDPRDVYDELLQKARDVGGNSVVDFQLRNKSFFAWIIPPIILQCQEATGTAAVFE